MILLKAENYLSLEFASRKPSPIKSREIKIIESVKNIVKPIQTASRLFFASLNNSPRDGEPTGRPKPKKSKLERATIEPATKNGNVEIVEIIAFGNICLKIILKSDAPIIFATETNSKFRTRKNSVRTSDDTEIHEKSNIIINSDKNDGEIKSLS